MNIDWTLHLPENFDIMHVSLAVLALLFLMLLLVRRGAANNQETNSVPQAEEREVTEANEPVKEDEKQVVVRETQPEAALQLLALLQKEARLIDFVQEDLTGFSDEDVGAAARVVHDGAKKTIEKYFSLSPIRSEAEETELTIDKGFDPQCIRLTGNVSGEAPYKGILLHKGWRVEGVHLPQIVDGHDTQVLAPAEVEL